MVTHKSFRATHDNSEEYTAYFNIMFHFLFKYCFRRQNPTQGSLIWNFRVNFLKSHAYDVHERGLKALTKFSKRLQVQKRFTGTKNKADPTQVLTKVGLLWGHEAGWILG